MSEAEKTRVYLLECFEPEVMEHPHLLLAKRRAWRAGKFIPQGQELVEEVEPIKAAIEQPVPIEPVASPRPKKPRRKKSNRWPVYIGLFVVMRIFVMVLERIND